MLSKMIKRRTKTEKILVVDDEPDMVMLLKQFLEHRGYEVISAADGAEGLEKAINEEPDLVLLDTRMPVMNGREMLERLRKHPDFKNVKDIPVIMVTGLHEAKDISIAAAFDIEDYITKPIDFILLLEKIAETLKSKNKQKITRDKS